MIIKRKYINGTHWYWVDTYSSKMIRVSEFYNGYLAFIKVDKVKYKLAVDYDDASVCLFDDGYKGLVFLPDDEKWCVSAIYNVDDEIVEWYFDMTKQNAIDEQGNPFYDDLFLDIAVSPDFQYKILDEDELEEALKENVITEMDYRMAYETCNEIIHEILPNKEFLCDFFHKYLQFFQGS